MALRWFVRPDTYVDSVKLMRLSESLSAQAGVTRAAAVMGTPLNVDLLAADGLLPPHITVRPDDLLVSVLAPEEAAAIAALEQVDGLLSARSSEEVGVRPPARTLEAEVARDGANLAVIAVPGPYAAAETYAALRNGLHAFVFSDNVPIEEEVRLKRLAREHGLLVMGPDCGTAILNGVGLGFANRVQPGPVGIVGASGTGIQQVCCLLDEVGVGVAQAIGTGGRDLSAAVDGITTRQGLALLAADPAVQVIVVISKPPDPGTAAQLHRDLLTLGKPVVACLLGTGGEQSESLRYVATLTEAAQLAAELVGVSTGERWNDQVPPRRHASFRSRVYGLYTGGTLRDEAARVLDAFNVPHLLLDLGDDHYTQGRAHPMIDPRLRSSVLVDVGRHPDAGALLLDVVLGDLAHPDPARVLLPALAELRTVSAVPVVAALIGTRRDPQGLERQGRVLEEAGVQVFTSNARAATAVAALVGGAT